ncbi:MAG: hypothetical protein JO073_12535 [Actinobacteria bacterium]|nr:hypothetical protein [Actinomycetota bacterium]
MSEEDGAAKSSALVEVNAGIREAVDLFRARGEATSGWEFMCECGVETCHKQVVLTVVEFDALKAAGMPVLAEGHPVSRPRAARERSAKLRDDAAALNAQAKLQQERARKNRRPDA